MPSQRHGMDRPARLREACPPTADVPRASRTEADFCRTSTLQWEPYEQPPNLFCSPPCCSLRKSSSPIRPAPAAARGPGGRTRFVSIDRTTLEGPDLSGAVLQDAAGVQAFYRLREQLPDGSQSSRSGATASCSNRRRHAARGVHHPGQQEGSPGPPPAVSIPPSQVENVPDPGRGRQTPSRNVAPVRATRNNDNKRPRPSSSFFRASSLSLRTTQLQPRS